MRIAACTLGLTLLLLGACARTPSTPAEVVLPTQEGRALQAFNAADGGRATWAAVVNDAAAADVVIIGEIHGHPLGQAFQAALFEDVLKISPQACGALEFFERDQQAGLDDYLSGVTNDAEFRKATGRNPGSYTFGHRAIVEACKAAKRPVIAANAPRRYVRLARTDSFDRLAALGAEQRRLFRIPDKMPEDGYRDRFMKLMHRPEAETHGDAKPLDEKTKSEREAEAKSKAEAMFRSQSVWDWTMAESVAEAMGTTSNRKSRPVVLIVGEFHIAHSGGLVQALRSLRPNAKILTISNVPENAKTLRSEDTGRANYVVYIGSLPED